MCLIVMTQHHYRPAGAWHSCIEVRMCLFLQEVSATVGRVVMEMVLKEWVQLINLSRFSFDRVMYDEKQTSKTT